MGAQCCQQPSIQPSFLGYVQEEAQKSQKQLQQQFQFLQDRKNYISEQIALDIDLIIHQNQLINKSKIQQHSERQNKSHNQNQRDFCFQQQSQENAIKGGLSQLSLLNKENLLKRLFQIKKNQFKHLPLLKINILKNPQNQIHKTYYLIFDSSFYIGEWKYHSELKSDIPFGIGRLYKNNQLLQGTFKTVNCKNHYSKKTNSLIKQSQQNQKQNIQLEIFLDGYGRYITSKGQQYNGQFTKNKLNGKGFYKNPTLDYYYQGSWKNGLKDGKGTEKTKLTLYDGGYKDDKKNGKGSLIFYLSHKYQQQRLEQEKKINKNHDNYKQKEQKKLIGKKIQKINRMYSLIGNQFKKKKLQLLNYPSQLQNNKVQNQPWNFLSTCQNQNFIYEHQSKNKFLQKYVGQFTDDIINGTGSYQWSDGKFYNGQWKQGQMEGIGQYFIPFGSLYKGQFKNDKKHGKGQSIYQLTQIYQGSWAFDLKHGYGQTFSYQESEKQIKKFKLIVRGSKWNKSKQQKVYFVLQIEDIKVQQQKIMEEENMQFIKSSLRSSLIMQNQDEFD